MCGDDGVTVVTHHATRLLHASLTPLTRLQVVSSACGDDGVTVVTLKPTTFQNVPTVEEMVAARKEDLKQRASSLTWHLRNQASH